MTNKNTKEYYIKMLLKIKHIIMFPNSYPDVKIKAILDLLKEVL